MMMKNKQPIEKEDGPKTVFNRHKIKLVFGFWRKFFTSDQIKLLIAEALNEWTYEHQHKIRLNGYLIVDYGVYLILKVEAGRFHHYLSSFYEIVNSKIEHHHALKINHYEDNELTRSKILYTQPFKKQHFLDAVLVKLIMGENVSLAYENMELKRLKNIIRHYTYCSAIDYDGGKGPVKVTLLNDDQPTVEIGVDPGDLNNEYLF